MAWSACFFDGKEGQFTLPAIRLFTGYRIHRLFRIGSMQIYTEALIIFVTFRMGSSLSDKNKRNYDFEEFLYSKSNKNKFEKPSKSACVHLHIVLLYLLHTTYGF